MIFVHVPRTGGTSIEHAMGVKMRLSPEGLTETSFEGKHYTCWKMMMKYPVKWERYDTFTIVRNPFDRLVSTYEFLLKMPCHPATLVGKNTSFRDWVMGIENVRKATVGPQCRWIRSNGVVAVDNVFRFERYWEVLDFLKAKGVEAEIKKINATVRKPYQDYYDDKTRRWVEMFYKQDLDVFGYEF
jgi:hypothetical protein